MYFNFFQKRNILSKISIFAVIKIILMQRKIIYSICFIGLIMIALSCNNRGKKDAISSDLVHIPVSVEGENQI